MKKKTKVIIAMILLVSMLVGTAVGYAAMIYQPAPVVRDRTGEGTVPGQQLNDTEEPQDEENVAVFSSSVNFLIEEDADEVNDAIVDYEITNHGLVLEIGEGTPLDDFGVGDIFYLEGDSTTPLGETYIGKIVSVNDGGSGMTYVLDDPSVDEVFDVLDFDISETLSAADISYIEAADGVTVSQVNNVEQYFTPLSGSDTGYYVTPLGNYREDASVVPLASFKDKDLFVEIELDLIKLLGAKEDKSKLASHEKYDVTEGENILVYVTSTGKSYHSEGCRYADKNASEVTLTEAINKNRKPCSVCKAPVIEDEGVAKFEPEATLTGKIGLEEIACDVAFDWDILNGDGLQDLAFDITGKVIAEFGLESNIEAEFGGRTTTISFPFANVKVQALDEKIMPLLFVGYNLAAPVKATSNEELRLQTAAMPLTVGVMIYVDASGKIAASGTAKVSHSRNFEYSKIVYRNGEKVKESEGSMDPGTNKFEMVSEVSGDVDVHAGLSAMVYVFNLNPVELAIAKLGVEAEGQGALKVSTDQDSNESPWSGYLYLRAYLKLMELRIKLKLSAKLGPVNANAGADLTLMGLDYTIFSLGTKNPTLYNSSEMSYSVVTAWDSKNLYYKDENGDLVKENNGHDEPLFTDGFFTICGIDESFIYILRNNPDVSGTHDIYRVSLEDGTNKRIVQEITNCLTMDERYIYYVSKFDDSTVMRIDRETLKEEVFYVAGESVRYMQEQGDGFYLVTEDDDWFAAFFGPDCYYKLLNKDGMEVPEYRIYNSVLNVSSCGLTQFPDFFVAAKMLSSGYLHSTAEDVYWLSASGGRYTKAEGVSGWKFADEGIFTTQKIDDTTNAPYKIVLYRAEDGEKVTVTDL